MTKAHTFQHNTTGVQIFIFHVNSEQQARSKMASTVIHTPDWIYLGEKTVLN
jgi:hypothetical protein